MRSCAVALSRSLSRDLSVPSSVAMRDRREVERSSSLREDSSLLWAYEGRGIIILIIKGRLSVVMRLEDCDHVPTVQWIHSEAWQDNLVGRHATSFIHVLSLCVPGLWGILESGVVWNALY